MFVSTSIPTRHVAVKVLAELISAKVAEDADAIISGIATLENAGKGDISFFSNRKYFKYLTSTKATVVILHHDDAVHCPVNSLIVDDPYLAYAKIAAFLTAQGGTSTDIDNSAVIHETALLGENVVIGPNAVVRNGVSISDNVTIEGGCVIGENVTIGVSSTLHANVSVYPGVTMGERVIIHSGAVIGGDGFGIAYDNGKWIKVPQLGSVVIGNDVEIGANTTIDRGAIEDTIIEQGVKLDNLIQIGHNVYIGENTVMAGCVGVSGSATIGRNCAIGGGAGLVGHITIADNVTLTGTAFVTKSINSPGVYSSGIPSQENTLWHRNTVRFKQLDKMARRLKDLEGQVSKLKISK
jgi:UDP-3-O-[3-hydroxymyristoyl] glucosamine N-acyltransferase